ncbi:MAG: NAD(P)-binding domain-containing protein [Bacteroidota bacterium]
MTKIGIIGSGIVAKTLGDGFIRHGYHVTLGTRFPDKLKDWAWNAGNKGNVGSVAEAAKNGEIVIAAVKGKHVVNVLTDVKDHLDNKIVVDTTNPIDDSEVPDHGVLKFFTTINRSLMEDLQEAVPKANFVKAFSCIGSHLMVNPRIAGGEKPSMFIAGNSEEAKQEVSEILTVFGFEPEDMGNVEGARAIEPLSMLWCIPGIRNDQWIHAFKLLK